ncbi:hypothetical protein MUY27_01610 [Mucilaginibacter sp. RS28]|uniref:HTH tetR-type domain-containing protein n=1 Tax=Mucilaginibacter straminoryzae TaxID=2932774 RepID=A0A9X1X0I3_9SPHI|nr:hypothetical protein [Mucilaginibacter straminoryzae]MCJ8208386.1 hypothetical protein [Mucilaginibacter straminoryzae]
MLTSDQKQLIIRKAIKLINRYGAESLSLRQVASEAQIKLAEFELMYANADELVICCVKNAIDQLHAFKAAPTPAVLADPRSILNFWRQLVEFNYNYPQEGGLIARFLKSPSSFPNNDIRMQLLKVTEAKMKRLNHYLSQSRQPIRFIAFTHLFVMASQATQKLKGRNQPEENNALDDYFHHNVEHQLSKSLALPIY